MRRIFTRLLQETEDGRDVMLVTVVRDRGGAPRGAGAGMLVGAAGRLSGTVGGGAVECGAERLARELLAQGKSGIRDFTPRRDEGEEPDTACGGTVTLLFSRVAAEDLRWQLLAGAVCDRIAAGERGWLALPLSGEPGSLYAPTGLLCGEERGDAPALCAGLPAGNAALFVQPLPTPNRVVIFGGGHIAQALVPLLPALEFRPVVFDDRPAYGDPARFPAAAEVICGDYERIAQRVTLTGEDYVLIMTDGHRHDLSVEEQVLRLPAAYVGVIGSRRTIAAAQEALSARGITPEQLARVHTPVGTPIRAVTPAEIAVSIAGELICCRAQNREGLAADA